MKRIATFSFMITATVAAIVVVLQLSAERDLNLRYNSFYRNWLNDSVDLVDTMQMDGNSFYLAGQTFATIYLGSATRPTHLLALNVRLNDTTHIKLRLPALNLERAIITVDSPYFHLTNGIEPYVYSGTLHKKSATLNFNNLHFTKAIALSHNSFGLVAVASNSKENTIEKKVAGQALPSLFPGLLQKQIDGIFCTDGMFLYNRTMHEFIYVYFYRNEYFATDTSFNLLYRANTIDTISKAKIEVGKITSEHSMTMEANRLIVNRQSATFGNYLLVTSNLLAANEDVKAFRNNSVIDVYDLKSRAYRFSFYLPRYKLLKARSYALVGGGLLACLYGRYLVTYRIDFKQDNGRKPV